MNIPLLILLAGLGYFGWRAWRRLPLAARSKATRGSLALLIVNLILIAGMVFLPGRFKLFAIVPALLTLGTTIKVLRDSRQHLRTRLDAEARFARAKRVN